MAPAEHLNFVGLRDIASESHTSRTKNAPLLVELDQGAEIKRFMPPCLLTQGIPAIMARMRHVVILKPALPGLITDRTIDWMMQKQELHRITNGLVHAFRI